MKFGIVLYPVFSTGLSGPRAFEYAVRQVRAAREAGFEGIFASHHYATGTSEQMFQPIPLLARLAAEGPEMTFGTSIFLLSLHNPLEAAELGATMDIITGGRFVFGVGQGHRDVEFESFGIAKDTRSERMEEAVRIVRRLWAEDNVTWEGRFYTLKDVSINPKPLQRPGPPIWVGGDTPKGLDRAARIGDAWLTSPRQSKGFIRKAVGLYNERRRALSLSEVTPIFFREMYVAPNREEAEREIMTAFEQMYQTYHHWGQPGEHYDRGFQELKEERIIVGNPRDVVEQIDSYREEFGTQYMFFRIYYPGMNPEKSLQCIRLFGQEVIPQFRG